MNWTRYGIGLIVGIGLLLQVHNAGLFNPSYGFDGKGHIDYLTYLKDQHRLPLPHEGWQYYQTPLYYLVSLPAYIFGGETGVQWQNTGYYLAFILTGGYLISRVLDGRERTWLIGSLALAALPVMNYLVPMISNEFLSDAIMGITLLLILYKPRSYWVVVLLTLGFYTKYTVLTLGPAYAVALWMAGKKDFWRQAIVRALIFGLLVSPILVRNIFIYHTPLAMAEQFFPFPPGRETRDLAFVTNLSWIPRIDLFHAHHYSLLGGTWNTFWHDGYQVSVPVVMFHKKAALLWGMGFPLTALVLAGFWQLWRRKRSVAIVAFTYVLTAATSYWVYNLHLPYPSELKAFFMSGLPVVYGLTV